MTTPRISPKDVRTRLEKGGPIMLVCAYPEDEDFHQMHLEDAMSLMEFQQRLPSIPKRREIVFCCG